MKKLGGVFYFEFRFEDEETEDGDAVLNTWEFTLTPEAIEILGDDFTDESDWFEELFWEIEGEFGVHDWASSPVDEVVGIGYCTYECPRDQAPACVERWREAFIKKVGGMNVSPQIYDLGNTIDMSDSDLVVFNKVKAMEVA